MKKLSAVAATAMIAILSALAPASAANLKTPAGAVILTIGGNIANTNRGPYDPQRDVFIKYHERTFRKAAAFDRAMLEALGTHKVAISYPKWGKNPITFSGPRLADVLKDVGWHGKSITTLALDGYGTKIPKSVIAAHDWILATRTDGHPLGIGGRGPLWLVFATPGNRPATDKEEGMWPWALFYIRAE